MKLEFALLASDAETGRNTDNVHNFGGGFNTLKVSKTPIEVPPFAIVMRFSFQPDEAGKPHQIELSVSKPDGSHQQLLAKDSVVPVANANPGRTSWHTLIISLGITFEKTGEYSFHIHGDGKELKRLPLFLVEVPEPQLSGVANADLSEHSHDSIP